MNLGAEYDADEVEFLKAVDAYRARTRRKFVAYSEILAILRSLGYEKKPTGRVVNADERRED